ncbi:MAG: preprotein translocase subunit SecE [bacterium]|nr:preprotein translocase subunit SecE [bacterium]
MNKLVNYIKSSIEELKKVIWPTPRQAFKLTIMVIIFSLILAAIVSAFGYLFQTILQQVIFKVS